MSDPREGAFAAAREAAGGKLDAREVELIHAALDAIGFERAPIIVEGRKPFDAEEWLARFTNRNAPALTSADIEAAADRLDVSTAHVRTVLAVESGGKSFGSSGRPIILFEPHVFYRLTEGRHGVTGWSYPRWRQKPYPSTQEARWQQMAEAAEHDAEEALAAASWGLFQIMGFHAEALGYESADHFARMMATGEAAQLDALVRFIEANRLAPALRQCEPGKAETCRAFARAYNGASYAKHGYHGRLAMALAKEVKK